LLQLWVKAKIGNFILLDILIFTANLAKNAVPSIDGWIAPYPEAKQLRIFVGDFGFGLLVQNGFS
jgi:hypothetical protein